MPEKKNISIHLFYGIVLSLFLFGSCFVNNFIGSKKRLCEELFQRTNLQYWTNFIDVCKILRYASAKRHIYHISNSGDRRHISAFRNNIGTQNIFLLMFCHYYEILSNERHFHIFSFCFVFFFHLCLFKFSSA